jgi:hypothetical protein
VLHARVEPHKGATVAALLEEVAGRLLADYNLFRGRLLIVVWLTTLSSPLICDKIVSHA